jgi:cytochrome c553
MEVWMRKLVALAATVAATVVACHVHAQQPSVAAPAADRAWAFPLKPQRSFPDDPAPKNLPGSARQFTQAQVDDLSHPPDWYPDRHAEPPPIVVKGHGAALACGACHLMSGLGHPESSDLTGLSADYIVQQMTDFRSGARKDPTRMNAIAQDVSDDEARQAAQWFARLPRRAFTRVVESASVPKTFLGPGRMRFAEPDGATEPIGDRIITVPEDQARARLRDPYSGFVAYVPPGSVAKGRELVQSGAGSTLPCDQCHGQALQGQGNVPRLAGIHPIYTVRQLHWFRDGSRNGAQAAAMRPVVERLSDEDILAIAAYLGALQP